MFVVEAVEGGLRSFPTLYIDGPYVDNEIYLSYSGNEIVSTIDITYSFPEYLFGSYRKAVKYD